jgi:hypothetical protein
MPTATTKTYEVDYASIDLPANYAELEEFVLAHGYNLDLNAYMEGQDKQYRITVSQHGANSVTPSVGDVLVFDSTLMIPMTAVDFQAKYETP